MSAWQTARMRTRVVWLPALVAGMLFAACGGESASEETLQPILTTTTTIAPATTTTTPTTTAAPTTVAATSTTTSTTLPATTTTSTTIPVAAALVLRDIGLGDAVFGADPAEVIPYVTSILGKPTADSGWADPLSSFGICPGTEVRGVTWGDLTLLFSDESSVLKGRRHFFNYLYGPPFGATIQPEGMRTDTGIGVGSTVADLVAAHPDVQVYPEDIFGPYFVINETFIGFLTTAEPDGSILSFIGGIGCGD